MVGLLVCNIYHIEANERFLNCVIVFTGTLEECRKQLSSGYFYQKGYGGIDACVITHKQAKQRNLPYYKE